MNYIIPELNSARFTCPFCSTLSQQKWHNVGIIHRGSGLFIFLPDADVDISQKISLSTCQSCFKYHIWIGANMVVPNSSGIPLPNDDMPKEVKDLYLEAVEVINNSPRSSAALLRLALQHLCKHLGETGENINKDISNLVKKGLDTRVQKALDIVRVTGNNAVHPGQLDFLDNNDTASRLFGLLNFIVDAMITQPNQIDNFFDELPLGARKAIEKRDASTTQNP
ncbi:DUF4145 domain-containing protein [Paenibacillus polymyxa]|uniref:DUF4145 domain-containing protein n=1 Tax=Paenibacillus polymyxa TaxID=1406 RepID=A0AAE9IB51_PAEPO|nr:DUF4145 domain-containing protein [Paenibacillus polymyxa]URJ50721.1 DUF4145 domain-containing protein [Paenibacillus polymyxa]